MMLRKMTFFCVCLFVGSLWLAAQGRDTDFLISGAVIFEDGQPVSEPVEVQLICAGRVKQRVSSDLQGQFYFRLGDSKSPITTQTDVAGSAVGGFKDFNQIGTGMGDTGAHGSGRVKFGRANMNDCEIRAFLPGFNSDIVYPGVREALGDPDVGPITLHRIANTKGVTVSLTSLKAPEPAKKAYRKAREELGAKKVNYSKAISLLKKAIKGYPEFASAWHYLGTCHLAMGDVVQALEAFQQATKVDPDYLLPSLAVAELEMGRGDFEQALSWATHVLERNPFVIRAHYVQAFAHYSVGGLESARAAITKVHESAEVRDYPGSHFLLGVLLAQGGRIREAAVEYDKFLALVPSAPQAGFVSQQLANWRAQGLIEKN